MTATWYDDHRNLSTLLDWLGDMSPSGFRHVIEKPWHYEPEYRAATAALDHEQATTHTALKDSDTDAYCNDCEWTFHQIEVSA